MPGDLILWQDDALLAANKPAGMRSVADGYDLSLPHLYGIVKEETGDLWIVHRLDKNTSGAILFARTPEAHRSLNLQFQNRETRKEYHALVAGSPPWEEIEIDLPLRVNGDRAHRTIIARQNGKAAATEVQVLQRFDGFTLVAAFPHTGYTHQIRAHLAATGFPLLADPLYRSLVAWPSPPPLPPISIRRTALHAYQITFTHPLTGERLSIRAPYPQDFTDMIQDE